MKSKIVNLIRKKMYYKKAVGGMWEEIGKCSLIFLLVVV